MRHRVLAALLLTLLGSSAGIARGDDAVVLSAKLGRGISIEIGATSRQVRAPARGPSIGRVVTTRQPSATRGRHSVIPRTPTHAPIIHSGAGRCPAPAPVWQRTWVPAEWRNVFVGHDRCGRPVIDRVLVREGYWAWVQVR
jgi:hypothetical protein